MAAVFDLREVGEDQNGSVRLMVLGVGGCGCNAITRMIRDQIKGVEYVAVNTDHQDFKSCLATEQVLIGSRVTRNRGTGGNQELGEQAADESVNAIEDVISGADMLFITAGMGGGTGTGAAPVIARLAKDNGIITVGVVTLPWSYEGAIRAKRAEDGIRRLRRELDTLIVIPNDRLDSVVGDETNFDEAMGIANGVLSNAVEGISSIISSPGEINLDFEDVRRVIASGGGAMMGTGVAVGPDRAEEAARQAISNELLDNISIEGAREVLVNIHSSKELRYTEFTKAHRIIADAVGDNVEVRIGRSVDEKMGDEIKVTVIATGFGQMDDDEVEELPLKREQTPFPFSSRRKGTENLTRSFSTGSPGNMSPSDVEIPTFLQRDID
ncbi:MAG TPA: cell division protein FtsZ [Candidatus Sabulitectum sp.]|mgnify:FL=1|nr:cell division protein FtsZ [Candidatus Sabulitectum sp.]HPJ28823.1 cell division protein FtsZ [Candidatus Sabulitectum sp.]HPR22614.1 cell division protein FtsZ [Candidatus Sabulitectum sp.]